MSNAALVTVAVRNISPLPCQICFYMQRWNGADQSDCTLSIMLESISPVLQVVGQLETISRRGKEKVEGKKV
jgi:S-ribosylhomocysteine lyase LuxS involved in autoinducer biosynthesis